jgi:putative membrane protein
MEAITGFLSDWYLVTKSLHVISVITWMAGIFYLPRLYVYHAEQVDLGSRTDKMFQTMERRLLRGIMNPSMIATWVFGLALVFTPGIVDWSEIWPWVKAGSVLVMTWFHHWLSRRRKEFMSGSNTRSGYTYRLMNEVPTVLLVAIVFAVITRF